MRVQRRRGNYLSNESAYRNTLLRDRLNLDIPAGHIHTPGMQVFDQGDLYQVSDATFDAWRLAIVRQAQQPCTWSAPRA
ncbi:hypothetical protein GCM10025868_24050 [Angustibacter aerolatus]|uniref:Uncharacterized protein n=1 Tax=Angustibacter aerolatus TaxID=1162965 RepID=A0ABQ6JIT2_9ACTN|nr:hypothetical protein [Angustibacter aerolatus]GMA87155.1 hypothetical protein GCM10025868_24050 [Angustibacter aerolatus]